MTELTAQFPQLCVAARSSATQLAWWGGLSLALALVGVLAMALVRDQPWALDNFLVVCAGSVVRGESRSATRGHGQQTRVPVGQQARANEGYWCELPRQVIWFWVGRSLKSVFKMVRRTYGRFLGDQLGGALLFLPSALVPALSVPKAREGGDYAIDDSQLPFLPPPSSAAFVCPRLRSPRPPTFAQFFPIFRGLAVFPAAAWLWGIVAWVMERGNLNHAFIMGLDSSMLSHVHIFSVGCTAVLSSLCPRRAMRAMKAGSAIPR